MNLLSIFKSKKNLLFFTFVFAGLIIGLISFLLKADLNNKKKIAELNTKYRISDVLEENINKQVEIEGIIKEREEKFGLKTYALCDFNNFSSYRYIYNNSTQAFEKAFKENCVNLVNAGISSKEVEETRAVIESKLSNPSDKTVKIIGTVFIHDTPCVNMTQTSCIRYIGINPEKIELLAANVQQISTEDYKNETINWQTYKDERYYFEIKYPNGWKITDGSDETSPPSSFVAIGDFPLGKYLEINIFKNYGKVSINEWLSKTKDKKLVELYAQGAKIGGLDGLKLSDTAYFAKDDYIYSVRPIPTEENKIFSQMLLSLNFIGKEAWDPASTSRHICTRPEPERLYDDIRRTMIISPDLKKCVFVVEDVAKGYYVVLDNKKSSYYNFVYNYSFSSNSNHFAYTARERTDDKPSNYSSSQGIYTTDTNFLKEFVVFDGKEGKKYGFSAGSIYFSPDGESFAYDISKGRGFGQYVMVLNNQEISGYDYVKDGIFSSDGKHFAFRANKDKKEFFVIDNQEGPKYDDVSDFVFSPDGQHFAYKVNNSFIIYDGQEKSDINELPVFSLENNRVVFILNKNSKKAILLNGEESKSYDAIQNPIFSSDGDHLAYIGIDAGKQFIVLDGKEGKKYDKVFNIVFSLNGERIAYGAKESDKFFVVLDGKEEEKYNGNTPSNPHIRETYSSVGQLTFSPDSKKFAYRVNVNYHGDNFIVLYNQKEKNILSNPVSDSDSNLFLFSSDSNYFAYKTAGGYKNFILSSNKEGKLYKNAFNLIFSDDNKFAIYNIESVLGEVYYITEPIEEK